MKEIKFNQKMKYKEICELMGDKFNKDNRVRKRQFKKWNKRYLIEKNGVWYTIVRELTEDEKDIVMNDKEYTEYIENNLIVLLKNLNEEKCTSNVKLTYRELFEKLGIINMNYYPIMYGGNNLTSNCRREDYCELISQQQKTDLNNVSHNLNKFFDESQTLLKRMITSSLKSMQDRCLIRYSKSYRLYTIKKIDNDIPNQHSFITTIHDCDKNEVSKILDIYENTLHEFNLKKLNQIYSLSFDKKIRFFDDVKQKVQEEFCCDNFSPTFDIILGEKGIKRAYDELYTQKRLNHNIQNKLQTSTVMKRSVTEILNKVFIRDLIDITNPELFFL